MESRAKAEATTQSNLRHSGMVQRTRPQMRNCASGNLEILRCAIAHHSSMLSHRPGMTGSFSSPHATVFQHEAGFAGLADAVAQRVGCGPRVFADPHLI